MWNVNSDSYIVSTALPYELDAKKALYVNFTAELIIYNLYKLLELLYY